MNLHAKLLERAASQRPIRIGLIGAGKFGSMYLAQVPRTWKLVLGPQDGQIAPSGSGSRVEFEVLPICWPGPCIWAKLSTT